MSSRGTTAAEATAGASASPKYFPSLDGLRLVCFAAVVLSHAFNDPAVRDAGGHPLAFLRHSVAQAGTTGVYVFFTLSGFLITKLLLEERMGSGRIDLVAFYARRTLRIWPVYYAALGIALGGALLLGDRFLRPLGCDATPRTYRVMFPVYALFVGNYFDGPLPSPVNVLWSLCVEEQFYVLFPITFALARRAAPVARVVVAYYVASLLIRGVGAAIGAAPPMLWAVTSWADSLLVGAALAQWLVACPEATLSFFRRLGGLGEATAVALLTAFNTLDRLPSSTSTLALPAYFVAPWATALLVGSIGLGGGPLGRVLALGRLRSLGQLTYAGYVFHEYGVLLAWVALRRASLDPWAAAALRTCLAIPLTLLIAFGSKVVLEDRVARLKRRFQRT